MPYVTRDHCRIHYEVTGRGPTLAWIHGLGSSTRDWEYQVPNFTGDYRVLTIDLRGHGASDKPRGPYRIEQLAGDVAAVLQQPENHPAHVVGLSLGGMVALQLALDFPRLVTSLVLVNTGPEMPHHNWRARWRVRKLLWHRWFVVRFCGMRRMGESLARNLLPHPDQADLHREFIARWASNDPSAYLAGLWALRNWSVVGRLGQLECPTCVIGAEHDYTPLAYKQAYAAQIPRARVCQIADSRHLTPIDQPDAFNRVVHQFLREVTDLQHSGVP